MSAPVALVTGAARGIGQACCLALAREGFDLAVADLLPGDETVAKVAALGRKAIAVSCDVTKAEQRRSALEAIRSAFGRLDCLVNNAGVAPKVRADLLEATEESFDFVMGVNLRGPYFLTQAVANWMVKSKAEFPDAYRSIINIASISAYTASVARGEYCLSKAAIAMMTKLYAARLANEGVMVFEVRPGIVATDMTKVVKEKYDRMIGEGLTPIQRWGHPEDIGQAVATAAAGRIPFTTGQVLDIDGGYHLRIL